MPRKKLSLYFDNSVLHALCFRVADHIEELFDRLDVDLTPSGKRYIGACPVHGGTDGEGFNIYPEGDTAPGYWNCYTKHCDIYFPRTVLGFTKGVLSHQRHNWEGKGGTQVQHREAIDFVLGMLKIDITDVQSDVAAANQRRFDNDIEYVTKKPASADRPICDRTTFRSFLAELPASYYLGRGYTSAVLDTYDVGLCTNPDSSLCDRVVVPVYDHDHNMVVGCVGRSLHTKCQRCRLFHPAEAPCSSSGGADHGKWKCSTGFSDKQYLYNYWFAKKHIRKSQCVVIVEGPGDVWRLEEAGIHNAVALLGSGLTDQQQLLLEGCGATCFIVVTDSDDAGNEAAKQINKQCGSFAPVVRLEIPAKDIGEMSVEEVQRKVKPFIESKMRK